MGRLTIAGLIAALTLGSFVLVAAAQAPPVPGVTPAPPTQTRAPFWPALSANGPAVAEWYSDVPWTQKLGTYRGNEIDEALVLPYEALQPDLQASCGNPSDPQKRAACMIETGVNNILGTYRTDTPYSPGNSKIIAATYCNSQPCIEVKLQASMFWTRSTGCFNPMLTPPCLQARPFGTLPLQWFTPYGNGAYYKGLVFNDGSSYVPQMPWYMAHYCDSTLTANDVQDPVCYGDYLSPMNAGFNNISDVTFWPNSAPFSVYPFATGGAPPPPSNTCPSAQTTCQLALAGFDLSPVPNSLGYSSATYNPYKPYNQMLFAWFNGALKNFPNNFTTDDFYRHFPWSAATQVTWGADPNSPTDLYYQAVLNPFSGQLTSVNTQPALAPPGVPDPPTCLGNGFTPLNPPPMGQFPVNCANTGNIRAGHSLYPRQCALADLARAYMETDNNKNGTTNIPKLRACGLNYEIHSAGWLEEWPPYTCDTTMLPTSCGPGDYTWWQAISPPNPNLNANQYGRTSFLFAGVPGMQLPVSLGRIPTSTSGISAYEQVHNSSIFSVYLPIANEADFKDGFSERKYGVDFYHTLLMTNHMESDPDEFAQGIRGRALWHNEYRSQKMYMSPSTFIDRTFAAAFDPTMAKAPFHNYTCDGCHVRNGSGIPITPTSAPGGYKLPVDGNGNPIQQYMTAAAYNPYGTPGNVVKDYTFTGEIRPMKLVFFDLKRPTSRFDDSVYSKPLAASQAAQTASVVKTANLYYNSTVMNFYGDSFHVTRPGYNYVWSYGPANSNRIVVNTPRFNKELSKTYQPLQVNLGAFVTDPSCQLVKLENPPTTWPTTCNDISSAAIHKATDGGTTTPTVGFMLLNGKRLGNLSAIEAIPNAAILGFYQNQTVLGATIAGEIQYNAGSRDGVGGPYSLVKECQTKSSDNCYIGRFGWLGDRVSLEDQVANAAFIEMNMTTKAGYKALNGSVAYPIRYNVPNCGPADQTCVQSTGNADLSEQDINRMAAYGRWLGDPTRSEFMTSLPDVIAGENVFVDIKCNTCHVIDVIKITDPNDTMLTKYFRDRLAKRVDKLNKVYPFLSYLGTDLLMHDMGYLSQVGNPSPPQSIRDSNGVVLSNFHDYVQKIRTPPLKGLRFDRFVTESQKNTKNLCNLAPTDTCDPACDFLLHDGRACDAIEAAFLHDGPAIKELGVIPALNNLTPDQVRQLRAFLYSL
jgi:CxxC motif-containing protein (DUF1111 family)